MKNAIISVVLFVSVMICVYFLNTSLIRLCDDIQYKSQEIEYNITNENFDAAYAQSLELLEAINNNNFITSLYVSHQSFDNLLDEAIRVSLYTMYEEAPDANSALHLLKYNAKHIKELQIPSFENIL